MGAAPGLAGPPVRTTPDAIVSHVSAAALLDLPMPPTPPQRATMTLLDDSRTSEDDGWRQFHRGQTPPEHIVIDVAEPYLVPARTVIDCMRDMRPGDALPCWTPRSAPGSSQARSPRDAPAPASLAGHHGGRPDHALGDGRRESWFESSSAWMMARLEPAARHPPGGRHATPLGASWRGSTCCGPSSAWSARPTAGGSTCARQLGRAADEERGGRAVIAQANRENRLRDLGLEVLALGPGGPAPTRSAWPCASTRRSPEPARSSHCPLRLLLLRPPPH